MSWDFARWHSQHSHKEKMETNNQTLQYPQTRNPNPEVSEIQHRSSPLATMLSITRSCSGAFQGRHSQKQHRSNPLKPLTLQQNFSGTPALINPGGI